MHIAAQLFTEPGADLRQVDRHPLQIGVALRKQGEGAIQVSLTDISTHGFRVEARDALRPGRNVWLKLPGIESLFAQVVWSDGERIGCQFAAPLHPGVVDRLLASAS